MLMCTGCAHWQMLPIFRNNDFQHPGNFLTGEMVSLTHVGKHVPRHCLTRNLPQLLLTKFCPGNL